MKIVYLMLLGLACAPAADEKDIARLPEGPGKELVGKICVSCHDSGNFRKARFTSEEWADSVDDMVQRGASGTPAEIEAVIAYLTKNFGKDSGVRINTAPFAGITSLMDMSVGFLIAFRRTSATGLIAGILLSLGYMAGTALLTPDLWIEPLGALVKTGPAIVLMLVALTTLDNR